MHFVLQNVMDGCSPFVANFRTNASLMQRSTDDLVLVLSEKKRPVGAHVRQYNVPTSSEVGVIMPGVGDGTEGPGKRDIQISLQEGGLKSISELNQHYDPLHYVVMFPYGDTGFHTGIEYCDGAFGYNHESAKRKTMSLREFYAHRIMYRKPFNNCIHDALSHIDRFPSILLSRRLFQQYLVDMYAKIEQSRLNYAFMNQTQLRTDCYNGLNDCINVSDADSPNRVGSSIILPSSHSGSPRNLHQLCQDSLAITREKGKPDVFMTITCNPDWPEVKDSLFAGQVSLDRPDILSRVFRLKLKAFRKELIENGRIGKTVAHIGVVEYQKRGLPHSHILVTFSEADKLRSADDYDNLVCAEIPSKDNPVLRALVLKHMIHNPCGEHNPDAPCMVDNKCSKFYPKDFRSVSADTENGYPEYRRRSPEEGGVFYHVFILL